MGHTKKRNRVFHSPCVFPMMSHTLSLLLSYTHCLCLVSDSLSLSYPLSQSLPQSLSLSLSLSSAISPGEPQIGHLITHDPRGNTVAENRGVGGCGGGGGGGVKVTGGGRDGSKRRKEGEEERRLDFLMHQRKSSLF